MADMVDSPITNHGDFPRQSVSSPEGTGPKFLQALDSLAGPQDEISIQAGYVWFMLSPNGLCLKIVYP